MSIAAIETTYKGKRFRSRLEVRWAMFFDELGIEWEYEPRQFGCPTAFYVPDFYLPGHKKFVEVKPENMLKFPPKVYLAGRMTRVMDSTIHPDGRRVPQDISCVGANSGDTPPGYSVKEYPDWSSDEGTRTAVEERWRCYRPFDTDFYIPEQIQGRNYRWIGKRLIDYRGPFTYADMSHGCLDNEGHFSGGSRHETFQRAMKGVDECDVLFVYIEDFECFGTLVEIGRAASRGKFVVLGLSEEVAAGKLQSGVHWKGTDNRTELWFAGMAADRTVVGSREQALKDFEEWLSLVFDPTPREQMLAYELTHLHGDYKLDAPVCVVYGDPLHVFENESDINFEELDSWKDIYRGFMDAMRLSEFRVRTAAEHARYDVSFDDHRHDFNPQPSKWSQRARL